MRRMIMLILTLLCAMSFLASGCGRNVAEQMMLELSKGYGARFEDGVLDGYRVYGYDASYLHGAIVEAVANQKDELVRLPADDVGALFPLVYFVALKYEDTSKAIGVRQENRRFRIQIGAIDYLPSSRGRRGDGIQELPSNAQCFTFFTVGESGQVEILSVDLTRNLKRGSRVVGRFCSYGSADAEILIWDAHMADRNRPEKILDGSYKKVFAVKTDRPFNYMEYTRPERLGLLELLHGSAVYRLCWSTPECMIFIPEALLKNHAHR